MQEKNVIKYKNVFDRSQPELISFEEFITADSEMDKIFLEIQNISDKKARNEFKRNNLFAVDLCLTNIIRIDIDEADERIQADLITKLAALPFVWIIQKSASGNLCVYIQYERFLLRDFKFWQIYYKLWLELTVVLEVSIDFLPEQNRLAYKSNGAIVYKAETPIKYVSVIKVPSLPYINTNKKITEGGANVRRVAFGSGK